MIEMPSGRSRHEHQPRGTTDGVGAELIIANDWIGRLIEKRLVQFRMGYGVHLELGDDHEVTIETPFEVSDGNQRWAGEPLTAGTAGALLPLNLLEVTHAQVATDGALLLGLGSATVKVQPDPMFEAWQVRGPLGLLIVCLPGGAIAIWEPESRT